MGDFLEISQMAVQKSRSDGEEVRVTRVVNLDNTPRVLASANLAAANLNNILRADNGERHEAAELSVFLDGIFIVLLDIVGEVVYGDTVVLDVLHDELLRLGQLGGGQGIGTANDGDDVASGSEALHELNVELSQTSKCVSLGDFSNNWLLCLFGTYPWPVGVMK